MHHDLFVLSVTIGGFATILGGVIFINLATEIGVRGIDKPILASIATLTLAWLWLPWLVYGLTLLPWSQIRKILPPVTQTETLHNPNGGVPQVEP